MLKLDGFIELNHSSLLPKAGEMTVRSYEGIRKVPLRMLSYDLPMKGGGRPRW